MRHIWWVILSVWLVSGCEDVQDFETLGENVASPIDVQASDDGSYFYILNADFDRSFDSGSILVVDEDGNKKGVTPVPRLGRSLSLAGNDMLVLLDAETNEVKPQVRLFDLSADPENPVLVRTWGDAEDFTCVPISAAIVKDYDHFFISCSRGDLYFGTLKTPRSESTLKRVRNYQYAHRALHLDASRELLIGFPTDLAVQNAEDKEYEDKVSFNTDTGNLEDGENEVPDDFEQDRIQRRRRGNRYPYQFFVYDIAAERSPSDGKEAFPMRELNDTKDSTADNELRWVYFSLRDFDGTPDTETGITDLTKKYYRTNFWEAKPDPLDSNAFYLSHRGRNTKHANNVLHVNIIGDLRSTDSDGDPLATSEVLSFERVYGFNGEITDDNKDKLYPGDFEVELVNGQLTLLVNHFRDLVNFRDNFHFGVVGKTLQGGFWIDEILTQDASESYYQLALNSRGKAISCAFYGNAVIPLEVQPGTGITVGWNDLKRIQ